MPWKKVRNHPGCSSGKPVAVVKVGDNKLVGCHTSEESANRQLAALNASEEKAQFRTYTYNGVTVQATGRRSSSRPNKKYERTVRRGGSERVVHYGDPKLPMRRTNPDARRNFMARHGCSSKKDPFAPGFWACLDWARTSEKESEMSEEIQEIKDDEVIVLDPGMHEARIDHTGDKPKPQTQETTEEEKKKSKSLHGAVTFEEFETLADAHNSAAKVAELTKTFSSLVGNILSDPTVDTKSAINRVSQEYMQRVEASMSTKSFTQKAKEFFFGSDPQEESAIPNEVEHNELGDYLDSVPSSIEMPGFGVWKDKNGKYRWIATYSNNLLDDDNPPEIISAKSQETFVKMVDDGIVDYPELWLWHVKESRVGVADMVDFTSDGFSVATGVFDPGREIVAENLSKMSDLGVSHGMLPSPMRRDPEDPNIITFHITKEISPLPMWAAANKRTGFSVVKGTNMKDSFTPEKRQFLAEAGLSEEEIAQIEDGQAKMREEAEVEGVPSKEESAVEEEVTEETSNYVTSEEVAGVLQELLTPMAEQMRNVSETIAALQSEIKELQSSDREKVQSIKEETPQMSLRDLLGLNGTPLDGRTKLAKDGPQETKQTDSVTGIDAIDGLLRMSEV